MKTSFKILKDSVFGRLGELETANGTIKTPAFVFCGTKGALKAEWPQSAKNNGTQIILSNTYHLVVYPGTKVIKDLGGLHRLTAWDGPMMTDSGGYQIFSLGHGSVSQELKGIRNQSKSLVQITEDGANFKSYRNGDHIFLSPEGSIEAQIDLGADLIFVLDECTAFHVPKEYTQQAMLRSHRWGVRSLEYFEKHKNPHQSLYGIVQGGIYKDLREESLNYVSSLPFFGVGIGGSLGKDMNDMEEVLKFMKPALPVSKPRHLLGIGTIQAILKAIPYGIDTFDCVYPTRLARHGGALVSPQNKGVKDYLNLKNKMFEKDERKLDEKCKCCTCTTFSRAYLHILLKNDEILGIMALTHHNIAFMNNFMALTREALESDSWGEFLNMWAR